MVSDFTAQNSQIFPILFFPNRYIKKINAHSLQTRPLSLSLKAKCVAQSSVNTSVNRWGSIFKKFVLNRSTSAYWLLQTSIPPDASRNEKYCEHVRFKQGIDPFRSDVISFEFFQEHHLPRFNVDQNLKSVHCSQQHMKLFCTSSCNIMIRCGFLAAQGITSFASN